MKLYVGNLHEEVKEIDLKELFVQHSSLISVKIVKDKDTGKSRGFAFVEFKDKQDANSAMKGFNGYTLQGTILKVDEANVNNKRPRRPSGLF